MEISKKKSEKKKCQGQSLINAVFSWSLEDVMNKDLYKEKVKEIPETFSSTDHYLNSFINPLLEETHADLYSNITSSLCNAPTCEVLALKNHKNFKPPKDLFYEIRLRKTRKNGGGRKQSYVPEFWDLIVLADVRPRRVEDLNRPKMSYLIAVVLGKIDDDDDDDDAAADKERFLIRSSKQIPFQNDCNEGERNGDKIFAVLLTSLTTNIRIWNSLNMDQNTSNLNIIKTILNIDANVQGDEHCVLCRSDCEISLNASAVLSSFGLHNSQKDAVLSCLKSIRCSHRTSVKLIWGPPGTGKTKTVASMLSILLNMKHRTLTCAPTNIAVTGVAKRLVKLVKDSLKYGMYGLGDVLLFGNAKRMKVDDHDELWDVFLDHRVDVIASCLSPLIGLQVSLNWMISLLEHPELEYKNYIAEMELPERFDEFVLNRYKSLSERLVFCMTTLTTHMPTSYIGLEAVMMMIRACDKLRSVKSLLKNDPAKSECVAILRHLRLSVTLPRLTAKYQIRSVCLKNAVLIFCTVSSSSKLHTHGPIEVLVIDEAAQLKECESTIPLQLPGVKHAILIGDEKQLPAMVQSKICEKAGFGRSLFERLVKLGKKKHMLEIQYRMHPSISLFPNNRFYENKVMNGPNVTNGGYDKRFLKGNMFGPYSFINISQGKEELDEKCSTRNIAEASAVAEIIALLYKESVASKQRVRVGCISSPYRAQVFAIQEKLGKKYSTDADRVLG